MDDFDTRLVGAAQRARDDLRMVILPGLVRLEPAVSGNPEAIALVRNLQAVAHRHADDLRFAMKDREQRPRRAPDLPCWNLPANTK